MNYISLSDFIRFNFHCAWSDGSPFSVTYNNFRLLLEPVNITEKKLKTLIMNWLLGNKSKSTAQSQTNLQAHRSKQIDSLKKANLK